MFWIVLKSLTTLCAIMSVGFAARKARIINDEISAGLSGVLLNIALPSIIIMSLQREFSVELLKSGGIVFGISFVSHFLTAALGVFLCRVLGTPKEQRGVWLFALSFGNVTYMGFPVINALFGSEALFHTSMVNAAFNLLAPTFGVWLIQPGTQGAKERTGFKINTAFAATLIGIALFVFSIKLPEPAADALNMLGGMTTPLSMLIIGGLLAKNSIADVFADGKLYALAFVKLIVIPLPMLFVLRRFISDSLTFETIIYLAAMPSAALTAIFAERYGADSRLGSKIVFMTTVLSLLTIPLFSLLI